VRSLHHDTLARRGLVWFGARCGSMRGGHEVRVGSEYVADAVAIGVLFHRHFRETLEYSGLEAKTIHYRVNESGDVNAEETGDVADYFVAVFEAKATRADFLSTFGSRNNAHKNRREPVGNLHYVVTDTGVCEAHEVPEPWGWLERRGTGLSMKRQARYCRQPELAVLRIAEKLLWNRGNQAAAKIVVPSCPECRGPLPESNGWGTKQGAWCDVPADETQRGGA
jgi:hypothetical protein